MKQVVLEFHPASEKPGKYACLLAIVEGLEYLCEAWLNKYSGYTDSHGCEIGKVTHWAYMPKAKECGMNDDIMDLIQAAYFEGWRDGLSEVPVNEDSPDWNAYEDWLESDARKRLERMEDVWSPKAKECVE